MARKLASILLLTIAVALPPAAHALGLGEIEMKSALNERLDAEIALVSARPEDLSGLEVALASQETFERYGLDRPSVLSQLRFTVRRAPDGRAYVHVTSRDPIKDPFLSFLVEARWPNGRLLREYTVLVDPPVFLDERAETSAPSRTVSPVSEQPASRTQAPATRPTTGDTVSMPSRRSSQPTQDRIASTRSSGANYGGSYGMIQRNETLWGIASRLRPDDVTINQMMVALYRSNPDAFEGNINRMKAGYVLRIPELDEIRAITRDSAFAQVRQHNQDWRSGGRGSSTASRSARAGDDEARLSLVAPEGASSTGTAGAGVDPALQAEVDRLSRELNEERQANELLGEQVVGLQEEVDESGRLLSVKDSQIAQLQQQLRESGETVEPVPEQPFDEFADESAPTSDMDGGMDEGVTADSDALTEEGAVDADGAESDMAGLEPGADVTDDGMADDGATPAEDAGDPAEADGATGDAAAQTAPPRPAQAPVRRSAEPGLIDRILGWLSDPMILGGVIGGILLLVIGFLGIRKMRSKGGDSAEEQNWTVSELGGDEEADTPTEVATSAAAESLDGTGGAAAGDGAEPGSVSGLFEHPEADEEYPPTEKVDEDEIPEEKTVVVDRPEPTGDIDPFAETIAGAPSMNLDDSDPISEADFHMAYGLYDQAADLLNRSIENTPDRQDLKLKLLEVYFVWGNKDDFLSYSEKYKDELSGTSEWDNVVIMGKQIAPEAELFTGAATTAGGAEASVDMDFGGEGEDGAAADSDLDIFGDLGADLGDDLTGGDAPAAPAAPPADDASDEIEFDLGDMTGGDEPAAEAEAAPDTGGDDAAPEQAGGDDDALEFDLGDVGDDEPAQTEPAPEPEAPAAESEDELAMDLDSLSDEGEASAEDVPADSAPGEEDSQNEFDKALGELSSFVDTNVDEEEAGEEPLGDLSSDDEDSLGGIEFEAGTDDSSDTDEGEASVSDDSWSLDEGDASSGGDDSGDSLDEVSTKLDLARAYVDMGDPDGARSILEEVVAEGDDQQKAAAEELLGQL